MGGERTERLLVEREYATVIEHENKVLERRWWFGCVEEGIIKWLWGSFGVHSFRFVKRKEKSTNDVVACSMCYPCVLQIPRCRYYRFRWSYRR